jgi:hypothetical protein
MISIAEAPWFAGSLLVALLAAVAFLLVAMAPETGERR